MNELDRYWSLFDTIRDIIAARGITDVDIIRQETQKRMKETNNVK